MIRQTRCDGRRGVLAVGSACGFRVGIMLEWPPRLSVGGRRVLISVAMGDRWPTASIGTAWRCWGLGEWQTDPNWMVTGWGPFWRSVRYPEIPPPPPSLPWPPQWGPNPWRKP